MPEIQTIGLTRVKPIGSGQGAWLVSPTCGGGKRHRVCLLDILSECGDTCARKMLTNCVISSGEGRRGKSRRVQGVFRKNDRMLPMGGRGILLKPSLQRLYMVMQLHHLVTQGAHIGLHGRWGLRPVLRRKGKRPAGGGGLRERFHNVSSQHTTGSDCETSYSGEMRLGPEAKCERSKRRQAP